jgi:hypothetical protein
VIRPAVFSLVAFAALLAVAHAEEPAGADVSGASEPAPPRWESLQVLPSDLPEADLLAVMKEMSRGLGVRCTHCHTEDRAAEDKPSKAKARDHLKMTLELERDWFASEDAPRVTCRTCHGGRVKPRN